MRRLFIAEKPELARAIVEGLGGGRSQSGFFVCGSDTVTYCFGHLLELCEPHDYDPRFKTWRLEDLPIAPIPWKHKPSAAKAAQLSVIRNLLDNADIVIHAGDPDDEGQRLVDEVLEYFRNTKPVKRLLINDNNRQVVQRSLQQMRDNADFRGLSQRALARQVADQLYGYNLTRAYTLAGRAMGYEGVLSVGRVQTPILGLVVRRDREHEAHQKTHYFVVTGKFQFGRHLVTGRYVPTSTDQTDSEGRLVDGGRARSIAAQCLGKPAVITKVVVEEKEDSPPLPYNLLRLQADAHRKFGLKPDQVKAITQTLRERHQLITYNRSDCEYLSDEQHVDAPSVLAAIGANSALLRGATQRADPAIKSRAFNSAFVSAHHAIIPTQKQADLNRLTEAERNIYLLIARAYIAQFYPKQRYRVTTVSIVCEGHTFTAHSRFVLRPGWLVLYKNDRQHQPIPDDAGVATNDDLSDLTKEDKGTCVEAQAEQKETRPPARYTIATLLRDLTRVSRYVADPRIKKLLLDKDKEKKGEFGGIGTPSTRDVIIKGLIDRGFLIEQGKYLISSGIGRTFHDMLPASAVTPDMTALWHEQQTTIAGGGSTVKDFVCELISFLHDEVSRVKAEGLPFTPTGVLCPACKKAVLRQRQGKNGSFWGCAGYPACRYACSDIEKQEGARGVSS